MQNINLITVGFFLLICSCSKQPEIVKEPWIEKPISDWPDFALTNEISFKDTTYFDLANSFLVNTGYDTLGVSCKHIFMVFQNLPEIEGIDLGKNFKYWKMYAKNARGKIVSIKNLINKDSNEPIGAFNTLKVRDWIIFELDKKDPGIYPLKIRTTPVESLEILYAVGWGIKQKDNSRPALLKVQCIKNLGDYFYTRELTSNIQAHGRSGSPVIDKNGYLVGIVSGAEGKMGVMGSVRYLTDLFDQYNIKYATNGR
jgi:hypothetical protein